MILKRDSFVTIIIPTYKDWDRLKLCLDALSNQSFSADMFEIIVVNNEPDHIIPEEFFLPINAVLLHEPMPGSYACRNAALRSAKGTIIGFTDSDCIPHVDWIANAYKYITDINIDRIGGKVEIFYSNRFKKTWPELYESVFAFDQRRNVEQLKASITANLFVKWICFEEAGFFDNSKKSGEDFGWNRRANKFGFSLKYKSDVVVGHPARKTYSELATKKRRVLGGKVQFGEPTKGNKIKKMAYPLRLIYSQYIHPHVRLYRSTSISGVDKFKVSLVILYLFVVTEIEYFSLLLGKKPVR